MCPTGNMWIDQAVESYLQRRDIWLLKDHQLWPQLSYGMCIIAAPLAKLEACLSQKVERLGHICTVREVKPVLITVVSNTDTSRDEAMPEKNEEVLQGRWCTWV
jgi:hypothetical protein